MKRIISLSLMFIFVFSFAQLSESNGDLEGASIYVIGSPTHFPYRSLTVPVQIKVFNRPAYGEIRVYLESTSYIPGIATNYPVKSTDTSADLNLFYSNNSGTWDSHVPGVLVYTLPADYTMPPKPVSLVVNVRCEDFGAYGVLKAELYENKGNGMELIVSDTDSVPRDLNENHIADGWENDFYPYVYDEPVDYNRERGIVNMSATLAQSNVKNYPYQAMSETVPADAPYYERTSNISGSARTDRFYTVDTETGPDGNGERGDGLTVFEEYRGMVVGEVVFTRFNPETKDVFYVLHPGDKKKKWDNMADYGIGNASKHPSHSFQEIFHEHVKDPFVEVLDIAQGTVKSDVDDEVGWVNTNSPDAAGVVKVYSIRIRDGGRSSENTTLGIAPTHIPYKGSLIIIFTDTVKSYRNREFRGEFTHKQVMDHIIGHEIGHTINLTHCSATCIDTVANCMMDPKAGSFAIGYAPSSHHIADYDLAKPRKRTTGSDPNGRSRDDLEDDHYDNNDQNTRDDDQNTGTDAPPDQPYGLSYSIVDGQFRLTWTDGGGTVTGFQYQYRQSGGSWGSWISAGSGTFIDLLNLVNGTTYQFRVRAMNGTVASATSDTYEVTTPTVPGAPTITRVDAGNGQVNINWTAPSNGGSDITGYKYQYRQSNGGTWRNWTSFGNTFASTSEDIAG